MKLFSGILMLIRDSVFPLALVRIRVNGSEQSEGNRLEK